MKRTTILAAAVLLLMAGLYASASIAGGNPPGQDPCSHGATGKVCRPDPQPNHGKDCEHHGKNGGVNEDHCTGVTAPTPGTKPTPTQPGTTVTVTAPGPAVTTTVTMPTPGPTKTVTKVTRHGTIIIKKVHIVIVKHHRPPKTTG